MTDTERLGFMIDHYAYVAKYDDRYFVQFLGLDPGPLRDTPYAAIDAAISQQHCARLPK